MHISPIIVVAVVFAGFGSSVPLQQEVHNGAITFAGRRSYSDETHARAWNTKNLVHPSARNYRQDYQQSRREISHQRLRRQEENSRTRVQPNTKGTRPTKSQLAQPTTWWKDGEYTSPPKEVQQWNQHRQPSSQRSQGKHGGGQTGSGRSSHDSDPEWWKLYVNYPESDDEPRKSG
ncbi:hypothetical protein AMATHDRAFT_6280 [Amanita thiersii Skay4041]|uniref:Secreted protein n=1 Tax=Amanita thiersii Skay4041 TaxID=703135 RepID=A0A2A9NF28_9AGAR|nr:hypothetical protein AMATHDRAFT_6280 [Amanita thiersii Skay4041]